MQNISLVLRMSSASPTALMGCILNLAPTSFQGMSHLSLLQLNVPDSAASLELAKKDRWGFNGFAGML